jgi:UDP-sulfoquinovose synthase
MKIIIFGGDGFCGWPTALYLSKEGHEITIVDNLSRRKIDVDLGIKSLTSIHSIDERIKAWYEITGKKIDFFNIDVADKYETILSLIKDKKPDAIIHFAEQRSAPYSMKGEKEKRYTVSNNTSTTNNILCAIVESEMDIHLVHLGTMGVYGYETSGYSLPEGYLDIEIDLLNGEKVKKNILHPVYPGSIYHLTKTFDQLMFQFYNENDRLRITDLHQGVVWGTQTEETSLDERLINRFDYDGEYGTVLNRFLMQSVVGCPLTVYGKGGQTRAFIHISDTVKCIDIALNNPPNVNDRVAIYNQMTETYTINELAKIVSQKTGSKINNVKNPRNEKEDHELIVSNNNFLDAGLNPTTLDDGLLDEVINIVKKYEHNCDLSKIPSYSNWTKEK